MRFAMVMIVGTCWLCLQFNQHIQLMRPGSGGKPVHMLPPVTPAELDAANAERLERIRRDAFRRAEGGLRAAI